MKKIATLAMGLVLAVFSFACGVGGGSGGGSSEFAIPSSTTPSCGDISLPNTAANTTVTAGTWTVIQNNYVSPAWVTVVLGQNWKITTTDELGRIYYGTYSYDGTNITYDYAKAYWNGECVSAAGMSDILSVNISGSHMTWTNSGLLTITFQSSGVGSLKIQNNSSYEIGSVYTRAAGTSAWSPNLITSPIAPGGSHTFTDVPVGSYDVRADPSNTSLGWYWIKYNMSIIANQTYTLSLI